MTTDQATRARALIERGYSIAAIDEALLAMPDAPADIQRELRLIIARAYEKMGQHPQALRQLNRILEQSPDDARALAHRGSVLDRLFQQDRARADLARAVALDADYAHGWENLFYVSYDSGDDLTCDRALDNLERLGASQGYHYRLRGARRLERGDRERAEADLRRACLHPIGDPAAADVMNEAGFPLRNGDEHGMFAVQREHDNPRSAIDAFTKALELGLSSPLREQRTVERLGKLLVARDRFEDAVEHARALTDRHPGRCGAWLTRAAIDGEASSCERAYELCPAEASVPYARHLLAAGRTQRALDLCLEHVERDPDDADAQALMGDVYMALSWPEDAKAAWLAAEALGNADARRARVDAFGPERGMDHFEAGLALLDRDFVDDAVVEFETAAALFRHETRAPGDQAHRHVARSLYNSAFLRERRVDDAVIEPHLREAVELDPAYADAMASLGNLCLRTGRIHEGLEWFIKAGELDPSAGQPWFYRARHFQEQSEYAKVVDNATKAFDAYVRRNEGRFAADAAMMRGQANEALGNLYHAKRDYDLAYDWGHPTGYAMGDHIRQRIAIEDPSSDEAFQLLDKIVERIERNECPWTELDFVEDRVASSERATVLLEKLKREEPLDDDQVSWLVDFLQA